MSVAPTISRSGDLYHATAQWTLTASQTGEAVAMPGYRLKSITASGTFGGAVTVMAQNADDQSDTAVGLKDRSGSAISDTTAAFHGIPEQPQWIYPAAASGVSSVVVTAYYERLA